MSCSQIRTGLHSSGQRSGDVVEVVHNRLTIARLKLLLSHVTQLVRIQILTASRFRELQPPQAGDHEQTRSLKGAIVNLELGSRLSALQLLKARLLCSLLFDLRASLGTQTIQLLAVDLLRKEARQESSGDLEGRTELKF